MQTRGNFILFDSRVEFKTWLSSQKVTRIINLIQNHHTWIPNYTHFSGINHFDRLESMRNSHIERDLGDIAQHLTTFPDGKIAYSVSRPFNKIPTGIKGANTNGVCIEHFGNFDIGGDTMTEEHRKTILFLNKVLCEKFNLPIDTEHVVYHHWWSADGNKVFDLKTGGELAGTSSKTCPGTNFFKGNTVIDARNNFIPFIKAYTEEIVKIPTPNKTLPTIVKERVYAENGVLKRCDGNYKIAATDVRHIKFETGKVKYKFVYEKGAKVSSLVKKYGADFGFNAPFFDLKTGIISGDAWDGEKVVGKSYGKTLKWHGLSVRDSKPLIGKFNLDDKQDLLVLGAPPLVENGQLVYEKYRVEHEVNDDIGRRKCQRTFIWIDLNGDLHLGIADGRVPDSDVGLSLEEMALFAKSHGAVNSITFDGGGSTILANQTGGLNQKLNTGVNERVVNHAILVFVKTDEEIKKEIEDKIMESFSKHFKDVQVSYQAPAIDFCKEKGYIGGVSANEFSPLAPVSRGDLAVIIQRVVNDLMKEMKK